jgi:hypothetical protein
MEYVGADERSPGARLAKTRIHFVCGALLGGLTILSDVPSSGSWIWFLVVPLVTGLIAAIFLDKFWDLWVSGF